jgi:hypothetical protein
VTFHIPDLRIPSTEVGFGFSSDDIFCRERAALQKICVFHVVALTTEAEFRYRPNVNLCVGSELESRVAVAPMLPAEGDSCVLLILEFFYDSCCNSLSASH